jgi:hypothetical protein
MSVVKLLSRIVAPDIQAHDNAEMERTPMAQVACALSAMIHDADHHGVPNS